MTRRALKGDSMRTMRTRVAREADDKRSARDRQEVADLDLGASRRTGSHLDRGKRSQSAGDSTRPDIRSEVEDASVAIGEDDVDREAHAKCVDRLTRRDDQRDTVCQTVSSEKSASP